MKKINNYWVDFFFLELIGIFLLFQQGFKPHMIVYLLASILLAGPALLLRKTFGQSLGVFPLLILSFFWPMLLVFLPANLRIAWREEIIWSWGLIVLIVLLFQDSLSSPERLLIVCLSCFSLLLAWRGKKQEEVTEALLQLKDDSWEKQELLKQKNQELVQSQETFIDLEISEERNRIARDIHDNVGHLLSSAIIQLGAIEAINQSDGLKKPLEQLKSTIHIGMDNIRESVHDLHETSLTFEKGLDLLIADFQFSAVEIKGAIPEKLNQEQERTLLMVMKEALANVMKHSNATKVTFSFNELPAFYRLQILDNGTLAKKNGDGIGLKSMRQRIEQIGGQLHISQTPNNFLIHIIVPKDTPSSLRNTISSSE
ncbi:MULTISPECIES: sensor histidine kinase [Enterococcus]|uniref:histidine kinase n=1 Tax=Candidatus Enterococcus murrayae TaxID=2815321 RepID=A0ABS3HC19_9ENTE|nr:sensor histidine kinase [Enterococcus sp. MJM16]MBO0451003.1 sensor histidine kinase [Enterococcus sp. MJM16]